MRKPSNKLFPSLQGKNILFVTHTIIPIFLNVLTDFTVPKCDSLVTISHPLSPTKGSKSKFHIYKKGKLQTHATFPVVSGPFLFNYMKDFFLTLFWVIKTGTVYDLGIATNNLNAFTLLMLKKIGRVKRVVFNNIDYTPRRYDNPIFNAVYHWLDRVCCYRADVLWNGTSRTNEARRKNGVDIERIAYTVIMPDGSYFNPKKRLHVNKVDRKRLVFLGNMRSVMGVDLILKSFKDLLKKIPDATLLLVGGGGELEKYKGMAKKLQIQSRVIFTGFIADHAEVDDLIRKGAVGLAPFVPDKNSYEYYSDVGKPKVYLAAGMPVIITRVPEIADAIEKKKAGIVIRYRKKDLLKAMYLLLRDDMLYNLYRRNAIQLSKSYLWENILAETYKKTFEYLNDSKRIRQDLI